MRTPKKSIDQSSSKPFKFTNDHLAKTIKNPDGSCIKGVDVFTHCKIVGLVARELIHRLPDWLRKKFFPKGSELVAAAHDIGKISPGFQEKIYYALNNQRLHLAASLALDKHIGGHSAVSRAAVNNQGRYIPEILGRHHGSSPLETGSPDDDKYGGPIWQGERENTLEKLKTVFSGKWPDVNSEIHADVLSGLTTIADWIGSGDVFSSIKPDEPVEQLIKKSLDDAGFINPIIRKKLKFEDIFPPYEPYPFQQVTISAVDGPGVYIIEAPMGLGKTEAALYSAYRVMEKKRATGIYFALPTQLTSDKIHERMNQFLNAILDDSCPRREALLLHGDAWIKKTSAGEEGEPGRSWFDYRKRGLLAPFAVGTIDQALMAVMNVRHGFVRTFGLAGKVVILDEIHTYDSYTGTIINFLVRSLKELHCTIIILSATLALNRRAELIGDRSDQGGLEYAPYPAVTVFPKKGDIETIPAVTEEFGSVKVDICHGDDDAFNEALERAGNGQQVLWLENTVEEAQIRYKLFGARAADWDLDCGLIHSRFLKADRAKNESKWVDIFGKSGIEQRNRKGRILVGTQVLEQSLDIDGDFMVSRICPSDMLLQRIGRLWRHRRNDEIRPPGAKREIWILAPELEKAINNEDEFGKTAYVYAPYILCRTLELWRNLEMIRLPDQMRDVIEQTYSERVEKCRMAQYKQSIEKNREKLERMARIGISKSGKTLPESKASTRFSEMESVDVLLIRAIQYKHEEIHLKTMDGSVLVLPKGLKYRGGEKWRGTAVELKKNMVTTPEKKAPVFVKRELQFLKDYVYLGDDGEHPFRAALVKSSGELTGFDRQPVSTEYKLRYDSGLGYIADKIRYSLPEI